MNAVSHERIAIGAIAGDSLPKAVGAALAPQVVPGWRPLVAILTAFWVYVALSNVLYAYGMSVNTDSPNGQHMFAAWDARVLQHLFLYPALLGCILLSLRIGWHPAWRAWPTQALLGLAFSVIARPLLSLGELITHFAGPGGEHARHTLVKIWTGYEPALWLASATSFLLTYGFALALVTGFILYRRMRDSELRVAALERAWSAAHLAALRMQLSPHTLFNLLHTIRGQIAWDPRAAQAMVVQLGDLLRRLLTAGERDFSRLGDELHFVQLYLELQTQRFADRLSVSFPAPESLPAAWVPSLILQPLVENAVVHGLAGHEGAVRIRIEVEVRGEELLLRVVNTTAPSPLVGRHGVGLRNVRERLAVQFADRASFESTPGAPGEWLAGIRMPLLREGPPSRSPGK